jgi:hypothetical protein
MIPSTVLLEFRANEHKTGCNVNLIFAGRNFIDVGSFHMCFKQRTDIISLVMQRISHALFVESAPSSWLFRLTTFWLVIRCEDFFPRSESKL